MFLQVGDLSSVERAAVWPLTSAFLLCILYREFFKMCVDNCNFMKQSIMVCCKGDKGVSFHRYSVLFL